MIPPPYGGRLVDRQLSDREIVRRTEELDDLPKLTPDVDQGYDAALLAQGAYSPLDGFMDEATLSSVLVTGRLPSSLPWPMPIVFTPAGQENAAVLRDLRPGDEAALLDEMGQFFAVLHVREKYAFDRSGFALQTYGTADPQHPNVAALESAGDTAVAGRVDLLRPPASLTAEHDLTPQEVRAAFQRLGWQSVAGYQTRNVPHTAHEHLQRMTLERDDIDGLFVHPVVGRPKSGDYRPDAVVSSYQTLIQQYYPPNRVLLATLRMGMRYAGPKAALFLAIVRRNFGCSHYIVGRDQAGVDGYYDPYSCHRIFDEFPIGIVPLRYREAFYCSKCREMVSEKTCGHPGEMRVGTSQTRVRRAIAERRPLPLEILRPEIAELLRRPANALLPDNPSYAVSGASRFETPARRSPNRPWTEEPPSAGVG